MGGRTLALSCSLLLLAGAYAATPPASAPSPSTTAPNSSDGSSILGEVDVVGEQPGPGLWKVSKGDHVLWLLGTLDHLPRRMTWRSSEVEAALSQSQELLTSG